MVVVTCQGKERENIPIKKTLIKNNKQHLEQNLKKKTTKFQRKHHLNTKNPTQKIVNELIQSNCQQYIYLEILLFFISV